MKIPIFYTLTTSVNVNGKRTINSIEKYYYYFSAYVHVLLMKTTTLEVTKVLIKRQKMLYSYMCEAKCFNGMFLLNPKSSTDEFT